MTNETKKAFEKKPFEPLKNIYIRTLKSDLEGISKIPLDVPASKPPQQKRQISKPFMSPKTPIFSPKPESVSSGTAIIKKGGTKHNWLWLISATLLILITIFLISYFVIWPILFGAPHKTGQQNNVPALPSPSFSNSLPEKNNITKTIKLSPLPDKIVEIILNNKTATDFLIQLRNEATIIKEPMNTLKELKFKTKDSTLTAAEIWNFIFADKGPQIIDHISPNYKLFIFNSEQNTFISVAVIFELTASENINSIKLLMQNWEPTIDEDINNLYFSEKGKRKNLIFSQTSYGGANIRYIDYSNQGQAFYWCVTGKYLIFSTSQALMINILNRLKLT